MKLVIAPPFDKDGVFTVESTFYNKDNELCYVGTFEGKKKEYTFIVNRKDRIIRNEIQNRSR